MNGNGTYFSKPTRHARLTSKDLLRTVVVLCPLSRSTGIALWSTAPSTLSDYVRSHGRWIAIHGISNFSEPALSYYLYGLFDGVSAATEQLNILMFDAEKR